MVTKADYFINFVCMELPLAYHKGIIPGEFALPEEEEANHIKNVLRKKEGDKILLCDGEGKLYEAEITEASKRKLVVLPGNLIKEEKTPESKLNIAIAPTKNIKRFEWFLEKAVEIGVASVIPFVSKYSGRDKIKKSRLEKIIISAMKQSERLFKPELSEIVNFDELLKIEKYNKFIAYCEEKPEEYLINKINTDESSLVLIGPEGDFSKDELSKARENNFIPVSLGNFRLRTETAGVAVAQMISDKKLIR